MELIAVIIGLALFRYTPVRTTSGCHAWFKSYMRWLSPFSEQLGVKFTVLLILLPIPIVFGLINMWIGHTAYGLTGLLFSVGLFIYALGPGDLYTDVQAYLGAVLDGDNVDALALKQAIVGEGSAEGHELTKAIFWQYAQRTFVVVFWFTLLGVFGALLYRLTTLLENNAAASDAGEFAESAALLHQVFDWLPVRILALTYILAGHFKAAMYVLWDKLVAPLDASVDLAVESGAAALGMDESTRGSKEEYDEALALNDRSLIVYLVVWALAILI